MEVRSITSLISHRQPWELRWLLAASQRRSVEHFPFCRPQRGPTCVDVHGCPDSRFLACCGREQENDRRGAAAAALSLWTELPCQSRSWSNLRSQSALVREAERRANGQPVVSPVRPRQGPCGQAPSIEHTHLLACLGGHRAREREQRLPIPTQCYRHSRPSARASPSAAVGWMTRENQTPDSRLICAVAFSALYGMPTRRIHGCAPPPPASPVCPNGSRFGLAGWPF